MKKSSRKNCQRESVLQKFFLQIKLCHSRLVCATKTSLNSSSCNLTKTQKSLALLTAVLKLNHSLKNLQFVCQSKVRHLLMGACFPFVPWLSRSRKQKQDNCMWPRRSGAQMWRCLHLLPMDTRLSSYGSALGHHVITVHPSKEPALYKCGHTDYWRLVQRCLSLIIYLWII